MLPGLTAVTLVCPRCESSTSHTRYTIETSRGREVIASLAVHHQSTAPRRSNSLLTILRRHAPPGGYCHSRLEGRRGAPPTKPHDIVEAAGLPVGAGTIKPEYDPRLTNEDLAPLRKQTWSSYNIFAFWMSDVHSVGGYVTAGSLFALGLASWQVLIALLVGIIIVYFFCNLVAKPSQQTGVPYPVDLPRDRSACSAPTSRPSSAG